MCLFLKESGENVADNKKAKGRREGGEDDNDDSLGEDNGRSPRRRLTRVRMTIPLEMMVGILLIGDVVDIVELGRQDSVAARSESPTRNTRMDSRKAEVAERGHQKRRKT